jgi:ketosteroid isomerase-like protein
MDNVPDTPLGRMYREHIAFIQQKNTEGILAQYTDDAILISSFTGKPVVFRGRAQIREHLQGILGLDGLESTVVFWGETDDPQTLMVTEKIVTRSKEGESHMRFADNWVLRGGQIAIHFAGMVQYADGTLA